MPKKETAANKAVDFSDGDSLVVDFNDVEDSSFEALPTALYPCTIADCEFTYSQNSGNPMWTLQLEVRDGEYAGRKLFSHLVFKGAGLPITKRQLGRVAPELLEAPFDPQDPDAIAMLLGKDVKAKVTVRDYENRKVNNVRDMFADDGGDSFM